jgi:hypothetical protein
MAFAVKIHVVWADAGLKWAGCPGARVLITNYHFSKVIFTTEGYWTNDELFDYFIM